MPVKSGVAGSGPLPISYAFQLWHLGVRTKAAPHDTFYDNLPADHANYNIEDMPFRQEKPLIRGLVSSSVTLRWADRRSLRLVSSANQRSTRFNQELLVGVKCRWKLSQWCRRRSRTGCRKPAPGKQPPAPLRRSLRPLPADSGYRLDGIVLRL